MAGFLFITLLALFIHESGHVWMGLILKRQIRGLEIHWYGFGVRIERHPSWKGNLAVALAGPIASTLGVLWFCYLGHVTSDGFWFTSALANTSCVLIAWADYRDAFMAISARQC